MGIALPPITVLWPGLAKSVLKYRVNLLDNAEAHAKHLIRPLRDSGKDAGAWYPLESAGSGLEACPMHLSTWRYSHHVSGYVALLMLQSGTAFADENWTKESVAPVVYSVATLFANVLRNVDGDMEMYAVRGTVGPDHSQGTVDSNTFTNMIARMVLKEACELYLKLGDLHVDRSYARESETWCDL